MSGRAEPCISDSKRQGKMCTKSGSRPKRARLGQVRVFLRLGPCKEGGFAAFDGAGCETVLDGLHNRVTAALCR